MLMIASKASLVALAGVYAVRSSNVVFHLASFTPLWGVAFFAFVMSLVMYHNPPMSLGWWLYTAIGLCLVGVAANAFLFFATDLVHNNLTSRAFCVVSVIGWMIVAIQFLTKLSERVTNAT
jgi:uncharacterized membrane protein